MSTLEPSRPVLWRPFPGESTNNFGYVVAKEELPGVLKKVRRKGIVNKQIKNLSMKLPAWKDFATCRT